MKTCCSTSSCVFVRGSFFLGDYKDPCGGLAPLGCPPPQPIFRPLGNILSATLNIESTIFGSENKYHKKYEQCARRQIEQVTMEITLGCASEKNIIEALYGEQSLGDSGSFSEQNYSACSGILKECDTFMLQKTNIDEQTLVVKAVDGNGADLQILIAGTDYVFEDRSVRLLQDLTIPDMARLVFEYDYDDTNISTIEAFKGSIKDKTIMFRGTNYAADESGVPYDVKIYRVKLLPVSGLDLVSTTDFLTLRLQGTVERFYDGTEEDCYFKIIKGA